jgi:hypothetical protein
MGVTRQPVPAVQAARLPDSFLEDFLGREKNTGYDDTSHPYQGEEMTKEDTTTTPVEETPKKKFSLSPKTKKVLGYVGTAALAVAGTLVAVALVKPSHEIEASEEETPVEAIEA